MIKINVVSLKKNNTPKTKLTKFKKDPCGEVYIFIVL